MGPGVHYLLQFWRSRRYVKENQTQYSIGDSTTTMDIVRYLKRFQINRTSFISKASKALIMGFRFFLLDYIVCTARVSSFGLEYTRHSHYLEPIIFRVLYYVRIFCSWAWAFEFLKKDFTRYFIRFYLMTAILFPESKCDSKQCFKPWAHWTAPHSQTDLYQIRTCKKSENATETEFKHNLGPFHQNKIISKYFYWFKISSYCFK